MPRKPRPRVSDPASKIPFRIPPNVEDKPSRGFGWGALGDRLGEIEARAAEQEKRMADLERVINGNALVQRELETQLSWARSELDELLDLRQTPPRSWWKRLFRRG